MSAEFLKKRKGKRGAVLSFGHLLIKLGATNLQGTKS